ncbi:MAG: 3-deoxy-8-phosphooctulonate synthase [Proteobacteria bacterium]|nr:3-deoxy-8-phosphooctulonate synthase [Pseudomonadota bacterium]
MIPVTVGRHRLGEGPLFVIAGPCVIEDLGLLLEVAAEAKRVTAALGLPYIFKSSFDKANRTSISSDRGPGLGPGLEMLARVKAETGVPVVSDIHLPEQAVPAAEVLDVIQIPAFLCRQTDLLLAAARTGRPINLKKGQFLAPEDMAQAIAKIETEHNDQILLTERGSSFGYHTLVVDMRSITIMAGLGHPVVFDATHSVQSPGGLGDKTGGDRRYVRPLAKAAVAAGAHGVFIEVHPDPDNAPCDGPNSVRLSRFEPLIRELAAVHAAARAQGDPDDD